MQSTGPITFGDSIAHLASTRAGASRVFQRYGLDFCCGGRVPLEEACAAKGLDPRALAEEIEREAPLETSFEPQEGTPLPELVAHILEQYHEKHRREVPRLIEMARKVESVHAGKIRCPQGLAQHLETMAEELEQHMQKEEQVLFPMIVAGRGRIAVMPIQVMEQEHEDHARNLERMRELASGYQPPEGACGTWSALYLGLAELELEVMRHVAIENHILFPRALRS